VAGTWEICFASKNKHAEAVCCLWVQFENKRKHELTSIPEGQQKKEIMGRFCEDT